MICEHFVNIREMSFTHANLRLDKATSRSFKLPFFNTIVAIRNNHGNGRLDIGLQKYKQPEEWVRKPPLFGEGKLSMKKFLGYMGIVVALVIASAGVASADQVFTTLPGATNPLSGQSVSATADFSLSGSTLTLTLSNTIAGIGSVGQVLTGITFTLSNGTGVSLTGQTGDLVDVNSDKTFTDLGTSALGWGFGTASGSTFELCVICNSSVTSPVTPSEGILGPVSADGKYDNANSSITGNAPHNPFVNGSATYTFTVPTGVTVSDVFFQFGTTPGGNVSTPEPASILLLALGLVGVPLLARRRS